MVSKNGSLPPRLVHSELILAHSEGWVRLMSDHQGCEVETVAGDGVGLVPSHSFGSPSPLIESRVFPTARRIGWINRFNPADNLVRDQYWVSQTLSLQPVFFKPPAIAFTVTNREDRLS